MPTVTVIRRWIELLEKQQGGKLEPAEKRELEKLEASKAPGVRRRVVRTGQLLGWLNGQD